MMLEQGAKLGNESEKVSPETENEFLNYIMAYEQ